MKKENQLIVNKIAKGLEETTNKTEEFIIKTFPSQLSYDLLTNRKYKKTHDYDPPWDNSGEVLGVLNDTAFHLNDYKNVSDFFKEYTGNWVPTFISGYGKYHKTYGDKYEEWFEEQFRDAHYDYLNSVSLHLLSILAKENFGETYVVKHNDHIKQLVNDLCEEIEDFEDHSMLKANEILEKVAEMNILFVYKLGEKQINWTWWDLNPQDI